MTDPQKNMDKDVSNFVEQIWKDLFKAKKIRRIDGFIELGGTSLAAIKFITAVERRYGDVNPEHRTKKA